jgi:hypothetical protein
MCRVPHGTTQQTQQELKYQSLFHSRTDSDSQHNTTVLKKERKQDYLSAETKIMPLVPCCVPVLLFTLTTSALTLVVVTVDNPKQIIIPV